MSPASGRCAAARDCATVTGDPAADAETKRLREDVRLLQHELDRRASGASRQEQPSQ